METKLKINHVPNGKYVITKGHIYICEFQDDRDAKEYLDFKNRKKIDKNDKKILIELIEHSFSLREQNKAIGYSYLREIKDAKTILEIIKNLVECE